MLLSQPYVYFISIKPDYNKKEQILYMTDRMEKHKPERI